MEKVHAGLPMHLHNVCPSVHCEKDTPSVSLTTTLFIPGASGPQATDTHVGQCHVHVYNLHISLVINWYSMHSIPSHTPDYSILIYDACTHTFLWVVMYNSQFCPTFKGIQVYVNLPNTWRMLLRTHAYMMYNYSTIAVLLFTCCIVQFYVSCRCEYIW